MQKQLTKQALIWLLASLLATAAISQERGDALATVPEYSDEPSGWVRIEVAIFADSNPVTLNAETWEHAPTLRYPQSKRWLTRYDEVKALMDEWGESAVTVNADGSIDVVPEPVEPLPEDSLELSNNPDVAPNGASAAPISGGTQVSMEELLTEVETDSNAATELAEEIVAGDATVVVGAEGLDDNVDTAAIDAVDIFNTGDLTDASAQFGSMSGGFSDNN
ncbi:MAG: hypothetical protein VYE71_04480, partial [Pseudomonadota bacterium]|nr:hypothetical protein [Pseudomonadota bacterium]